MMLFKYSGAEIKLKRRSMEDILQEKPLDRYLFRPLLNFAGLSFYMEPFFLLGIYYQVSIFWAKSHSFYFSPFPKVLYLHTVVFIERLSFFFLSIFRVFLSASFSYIFTILSKIIVLN